MEGKAIARKFFERNIKISYANAGLMWGRFFVPVLALFYIASKVSLDQFTIIMSVFALSTLLLEIPTGIVADLLGKKKTLILARVCYIIEIAIIAFFNGFWPFLIAKVISGFGVSLSSGTGSALLYDSLKKMKRQDEHKKIRGNVLFVSYASMAVVFIVGAYLFTLNNKLPAYASLPVVSLGLVLTFFMKEPYSSGKKFNVRNYLRHLKKSVVEFWHNRYLKYLAFLTFFVGSAISMMYSFSSAYYKEILIPVSLIGVVAFAGSMISAYTSKRAHKFEERLGEKKSLVIIQFVVLAAVILMSLILPIYGIAFMFLISLVDGFYSVLIGDYTNRHIKSSNRATMLSINSMFSDIGVFIIFPVIGFMNKAYSMHVSLLSFGIFLALCVAFSLAYYWRVRVSRNHGKKD